MTDAVLVPHDGSELAQKALLDAIATFPDGRIVLFHVIDPFDVTETEHEQPLLTEEWHEDQQAATADLFAEIRDSIEGVTLETATAVGSPPQAIVAAVEETDVDRIVMGSRGRTHATTQLGSTAEVVIRRAPVPVTVVR